MMLIEKEATLVKNGLLMHSQEERAGLDPALFQLLRELTGIHSHLLGNDNAIHPIDISRPGFFDGELQTLDAFQPMTILFAHPAFTGDDLVYPLHLGKSQCGLQICQTKVETQLLMVEAAVRLKTEITEGTAFLGEYCIIREYHASFPRRDQFVGVETKTA